MKQTGLVQAAGKTARELLPELENYWFEVYGKVALTGEPLRFEHGSEAMNRWFEVSAFRTPQPHSRQSRRTFQRNQRSQTVGKSLAATGRATAAVRQTFACGSGDV